MLNSGKPNFCNSQFSPSLFSQGNIGESILTQLWSQLRRRPRINFHLLRKIRPPSFPLPHKHLNLGRNRPQLLRPRSFHRRIPILLPFSPSRGVKKTRSPTPPPPLLLPPRLNVALNSSNVLQRHHSPNSSDAPLFLRRSRILPHLRELSPWSWEAYERWECVIDSGDIRGSGVAADNVWCCQGWA